MKHMDPKTLSANGKKLFDRIEFDSKERLISEIRKHPFGLFLRYLSGLIVIVVFSVIFFIIPAVLKENGSYRGVEAWSGLFGLLGFVLIVLSIAITVISAYLYESNVLLITTDKMAQILNRSIFNTKVSQLSIGDVQDVTVKQVGIFAKFFNYGTIVIETAGEQSNLTFNFIPDPFVQAKAIVASHEENLKLYGN